MMLCFFRTTASRAYFLHILLLCLPFVNSFLVTSGFSTRSRIGNNSKYVTKSSVSTPTCCTKRGKRQNLRLFESVSPDESSSPSPPGKKKKRASKKKSLILDDEVAIVKNIMSAPTSSDSSSAEAQDRLAEYTTAEAATTTKTKESKRLVWKPVGRVNHKGIPITLLDSPKYVTKGFPYGVVVEETEEDDAEDSQGDDSEIASFDQLFSQQSNDQQEQMELQRQKLEDEIYDKYEYYKPSPKDFDEDGLEILSSPIFGPYNPIDERAIVTPLESYMVAEHSKNENSTLPSTAVFLDEEETTFQEEVRQIRKEMKRLDTYIDPHLQLPVPRNVRPWHGTVQEDKIPYEPKDFMNNRFTKPEDKTDFTKLDPYTARKTAVRLALMDNNEWLPAGVSEAYFEKQSKWFRENNILFGTLRKGECDPSIVEKIQPTLKKLGSIVQLLSIQDGVFRFHYHGPMKHRRGMQSWTKMMIHECSDVQCTGVVFETGMRIIDERDTLFREYNCYGNPIERKVYPVDIPGIESYH